jgi:V8-like Glu-specific endopeptidase
MLKNMTIGVSIALAIVGGIGFVNADEKKTSLKSSLHVPAKYPSETLCGISDLQEVERYDDMNGTLEVSRGFVDAHEGAVGNIRWDNSLDAGVVDVDSLGVSGVRWCTGTLLPGNRFLTAGHCFDVDPGGWDTPVDSSGVKIPPAQIAQNMHVDFNYQTENEGRTTGIASYDIASLLEYRLGNLDYAIVQLAGNPGRDFPVARLDDRLVNAWDAMADRTVTMIQHPLGRLKEVASGLGLQSASAPRLLYTDLDTEGGSSGSGVIDTFGYVLGVHTNGGCNSAGGGANRGNNINEIRALSPIVQDLFDQYQEENAVGFNLNFNDDRVVWANGGEWDWTVRNNATPSGSTGPTNFDGRYAYVETSSGHANSNNDEAILVGHPFTPTNNQKLFFDYHMYGSHIGSLSVEVQVNGDAQNWQQIWLRDGQQHSSGSASWSAAIIELATYENDSIRLRFKAVAAGGYIGDIAIDNIKISQIGRAKACIATCGPLTGVNARYQCEMYNSNCQSPQGQACIAKCGGLTGVNARYQCEHYALECQ